MKKKYRLVFFGSPDFALPPLKTLYLGGYEIVGVYTQEPKKKSRGMKELKNSCSYLGRKPATSCLCALKIRQTIA
jgi:methionyl-tRNA formyltransferase